MTQNAAVPAELLSQVPPSLKSSVENYWENWLSSCEANSIDPQQTVPLDELGKTWACSDFVARNCIRYTEGFSSLQSEGFLATRSLDVYREMVSQALASGNEVQQMKELRELRQLEMLRIAWRDLNLLADTAVILKELTDFAEAVVAVTLQYLEQQQAAIFGMPRDANGEEQALLTFAMGKMGGGELNFSSDIDLIFIFPDEGETPGPRRKSHYEFYLAVIRKLVKLLDEVTVDGFVFRVDTRLRPFGESGPLAMSFSGAEQYYQLHGRDWERYAMIKARLITGREQDRKYLRSLLTPFIYRRYLDYSMLESIREMKAMINAQMKRKGMIHNVKLGPGGIREIEFIGQTFQLIRGGREPELRERGLIKVLKLIGEMELLEQADVEKLVQAYWYLRKLENRLQMQRDQQTHTLPDDEQSRQRLCLAMQLENWQQLQQQLGRHQGEVDRIFQSLIATETEEQEVKVSPFVLYWSHVDTSEAEKTNLRHYLEAIGYSSIDEIMELLGQLRSRSQLKHISEDSARMLTQLMDSLIMQIADYSGQVELLDRVCRIIKALAGRKVYISLLYEHPQVQQQMLVLCSTSEWFTERLIDYPILLDSLLHTADSMRNQFDVKRLLQLELQRIDSDNESPDAVLELQMDRMRQFKRHMVFTAAILDVFHNEPVETVSDRLTELADALLEKILQFSWQVMVGKYGEPSCVIDGEAFRPTISIIAYGKLGGNELGYDSDLDIVFLHNSSGEKQYTTGEKEIDNQTFFARVAQRVIHFLNTRTYSGVLYEADIRLRPDGQAGLMVSSVSAFETYQLDKAWTWEHQALIRARFVTGDELIEQEFGRIRRSVLQQVRDRDRLLAEVVEMREKMRTHLAGKSDDFDIKQDSGGLVDIEFMTQAGILIHAHEHVACTRHTATLRLIGELTRLGWYTAEEADDIANAYRYFRKLKHWQKLQCEADVSEIPLHRDKVTAVWQRLMPEKIV